MARGSAAKEKVILKIKEVFGNDFIGEFDKKVYVWADDNGERVQIALAMTCPKTMVGTVNTNELSYNTGRTFESNTTPVAPDNVEISEKERQDVKDLLTRMGL